MLLKLLFRISFPSPFRMCHSSLPFRVSKCLMSPIIPVKFLSLCVSSSRFRMCLWDPFRHIILDLCSHIRHLDCVRHMAPISYFRLVSQIFSQFSFWCVARTACMFLSELVIFSASGRPHQSCPCIRTSGYAFRIRHIEHRKLEHK